MTDDATLGIREALVAATLDEIPWATLAEIEILTTPDGPFAEDVFFLCKALDGASCVVSNEVVGANGILAAMQRLPGFDHDAVIRAMTSTDYARFPCWRR